MHEILAQVERIVKSEADENDWQYHIKPVMFYAKQLAQLYEVNCNRALIAAALHDIGRIRHGCEDHHLSGIPVATKILNEFGCSEEFIEEVKHIIKTHRGDPDDPPKTKLAEIVMNADALAHFNNVPYMLFELSRKYSFAKTMDIAISTIRKDWLKKLTLPEAFRLAGNKPDLAFQILAYKT